MEAWLRAKPLSTPAEQLEQGRFLQRAMDNRFGELVQDNKFWPRWTKQLANLTLTSIGWEYGTLAAYGGAVQDAMAGRFSTRVRWLMGVTATTAMQATAYQMFRSGQAPDLLTLGGSALTGGNLPSGQKDRVRLPGPDKELAHMYGLLRNANGISAVLAAPFRYVGGKANPLVRSAEDFASTLSNSRPMSEFLGSLAKNTGPIFMQQETQRGSVMTPFDKWLGVKQDERAITDEAALSTSIAKGQEKQDNTKAWRDYFHDQNLANPTGVAKPPSTFQHTGRPASKPPGGSGFSRGGRGRTTR